MGVGGVAGVRVGGDRSSTPRFYPAASASSRGRPVGLRGRGAGNGRRPSGDRPNRPIRGCVSFFLEIGTDRVSCRSDGCSFRASKASSHQGASIRRSCGGEISMRIARFVGPIAASAVGVAFMATSAHAIDPPLPPDIYLYTDRPSAGYDDPSYTDSGGWNDGDIGYYYEGRPGKYAFGDETAQWMLGQSGNYTVQIHWASSSGHTDDAQYDFTSASGTQTFHINERQNADQGTPLIGDFNPLNPSYSGWYTLGIDVPLNLASNIALSRGDNDTGGVLVGNAVRLAAGVDVIVDEQANATVNGVTFA